MIKTRKKLRDKFFSWLFLLLLSLTLLTGKLKAQGKDRNSLAKLYNNTHTPKNTYPLKQDLQIEISFSGDGIFLAENQPYSFYNASYGPDSRYKFRMTLNSGGEDFYEWFGSDEADVGRPDDSSPDPYYFIYPAPESAGSYDYYL